MTLESYFTLEEWVNYTEQRRAANGLRTVCLPSRSGSLK